MEFAGLLRERIAIDRPSSERNAMGLEQPAWDEWCRCLASVTLEAAGSEVEAQALSAMPRYRIVIRRRDGVALDQRIRWRGRVLAIRQLLEDPKQRDRILLRCMEVRP